VTEDHSPVIRVESDGPVRIVTLNRPATMNAFDREMQAGLPRVLTELGQDREARAVVLTGAGDAFSAGGDIGNFPLNRADLYHRRAGLREGRRLFDELISLHLPVVAAVNGPAVGLGCTVATACDIVFMAEDAFFADPHVTVALVAGDGGAVTWPALTSLLKVKQYLLTGDRMPAREALAIGMANFVVPPGELLDAATAFARRLADLPPQAVQDTKLVLNQGLRERAASVLPFGLAAESQSSDTAEYAAVPARFEAERAARRAKRGSGSGS
jgi:enoyl-CoA hydratase/carnithine racemase